MNSTINPFKEFVAELTSTEFEKYCLEIIQEYAEEEKLKNFHIEHNKKIQTYDGIYQIDIYAEFIVLNVQRNTRCQVTLRKSYRVEEKC